MAQAIFTSAVVVLAAVATGCGAGSTGSVASGSQPTATKLVAKVEHTTAKVEGGSIVASAKVTEGGSPGEHLALRYGLVDAVSGVRASEEERLAAKYTTTSTVSSKEVSIRFRKPDTPTDYLLHVALYGPDGSYLASSDSDVFTVR